MLFPRRKLTYSALGTLLLLFATSTITHAEATIPSTDPHILHQSTAIPRREYVHPTPAHLQTRDLLGNLLPIGASDPSKTVSPAPPPNLEPVPVLAPAPESTLSKAPVAPAAPLTGLDQTLAPSGGSGGENGDTNDKGEKKKDVQTTSPALAPVPVDPPSDGEGEGSGGSTTSPSSGQGKKKPAAESSSSSSSSSVGSSPSGGEKGSSNNGRDGNRSDDGSSTDDSNSNPNPSSSTSSHSKGSALTSAGEHAGNSTTPAVTRVASDGNIGLSGGLIAMIVLVLLGITTAVLFSCYRIRQSDRRRRKRETWDVNVLKDYIGSVEFSHSITAQPGGRGGGGGDGGCEYAKRGSLRESIAAEKQSLTGGGGGGGRISERMVESPYMAYRPVASATPMVAMGGNDGRGR
ncbi:hypothetical protein BC939DRAFT_271781 [Gamsiella multidivaricata]|uniref:uncharacterized protein n=1 Tax=Gamsiella multidivaricata TaxID=101098 RepID=UPI00221EA298|nr:uncharacterized protein BC939DRAFT_271781 [Gamsiella multidivaricata]KAI7819094.1 hypothetical protein BC939DRAFT_271781 [Gamsiella multidivaricata]